MAEKKSFKFSDDNKTVTIGGKTYSKAAFKSQFAVVDQTGGRGVAEPRQGKSVKQVSAKTADEAKASADKKSAKKAASSLNAASKPSTSSSADAARAAAAKRAQATAPSSRTAAQNIAISRTTGGIAGKGAKSVNPVYRMMGGGLGGAGGGFPNTPNQ